MVTVAVGDCWSLRPSAASPDAKRASHLRMLGRSSCPQREREPRALRSGEGAASGAADKRRCSCRHHHWARGKGLHKQAPYQMPRFP